MATHCMGYVAGADLSFSNSLRTQQSARICVFVAVASPFSGGSTMCGPARRCLVGRSTLAVGRVVARALRGHVSGQSAEASFPAGGSATGTAGASRGAEGGCKGRPCRGEAEAIGRCCRRWWSGHRGAFEGRVGQGPGERNEEAAGRRRLLRDVVWAVSADCAQICSDGVGADTRSLRQGRRHLPATPPPTPRRARPSPRRVTFPDRRPCRTCARGQVDVDQCKDLQSQYGVSAMPTFKMLKNGKEVDSMQGADDAALRAGSVWVSGTAKESADS